MVATTRSGDAARREARVGGRWSSAAWLPVPGQELADAIDRMIGNAGKHVAQISLRVEATHFGGFDEGVHRGGSHAAGIGADKKIIFSRQCKGADCAFDGIVG